MPGILGQMGPDSMNVLRKMAEQLQLGGQGRPDGAEAAAAGEKEADEQDVDADEPPELVPAAEDADKQKGGSLDDLVRGSRTAQGRSLTIMPTQS